MRTVTLFILLTAILSINNLSAQTRIWHRSDTTQTNTGASRVALDGVGNVFAGLQGNNAAVVLKFDTAGTQDWLVAYQQNSAVTFNSLLTDAAGNTYICGNLEVFGHGDDAFIAKISPLGTVQWSPTYDYQHGYDDYAAIIMDNNGNIIAAGTASDSTGNGNVLVTKYTPNGTLSWTSHHGSASFDYTGKGVATDAVGNIYVYSYRNGFSSGLDFNVVKFDSVGTFQWEQTINGIGTYDDIPKAIAVDNNGNVYLAGNIDSAGTSLGFLTKVDAAGNARWAKIIRSNSSSNLFACVTDGSGNVYIGGDDSSGVASIIRIDTATGNNIWAYRYANIPGVLGGSLSAMVYWNGNLYATGSVVDSPAFQNVLTLKVSSSGQLLWSDTYKNIDSTSLSNGESIVVGSDGNFYVGAATGETNGGATSATVIRYHETPTGIFEMAADAPFTVSAYPNPTDKLLQFTIDIKTTGRATMDIYDMTGNHVANVVDRTMQAGKNTAQWDASALPQGTYLYEMVTPTGKASGKFIKL